MNKLGMIALVGAFTGLAFGQAVNVNNFTTGYTQNFDSLPSTGTSSTMLNNSLTDGSSYNLPEWVYANSGTAATSLLVGTGSTTTGGFYSFGVTGSHTISDRSFGDLGSNGTGNNFIGVRVKNNTGVSTGTFVIQFDIEQWRNGGNAAPDNVQSIGMSYNLFDIGSYSTAGFLAGTGYATTNIVWQDIDLTTSAVGAQNFNNSVSMPNTGTSATALDGNLNANRRQIRAVVQLFGAGQSWDAGEELCFRFSDPNHANNDHAFSVDNVVVVPEPASVAILGIGAFGLIARRRRKN